MRVTLEHKPEIASEHFREKTPNNSIEQGQRNSRGLSYWREMGGLEAPSLLKTEEEGAQG